MRLTTLLDTLNNGGNGPWPPEASTLTDPEFDLVISSLIPCRQNDAELWFAERESEVEQAKALCRACPVREGCLAGAVDRREPWGVWGGEVFVDGVVVPRKRGRGRPRKVAAA
ncbi:WhiB family transcriptional regulator [Isoptericola sp. b441]|uniref:Transcriptional regulator WhiB n=1 Tax=Actinotalea lenta TaxID=3064654 RepID=A0ABT9DBP8_9CELL|nr:MULTISPECIES: WhiB family transcriptional regulator [unclassified Isoptericola]MDO8108304.1 WhiB family transcriptional regulator [Isoptericola sp. b441]MDO8122683.1 WhiB family transcriptional regulator [Isoptericola sp. b490]